VVALVGRVLLGFIQRKSLFHNPHLYKHNLSFNPQSQNHVFSTYELSRLSNLYPSAFFYAVFANVPATSAVLTVILSQGPHVIELETSFFFLQRERSQHHCLAPRPRHRPTGLAVADDGTTCRCRYAASNDEAVASSSSTAASFPYVARPR
jgi:hypothetical protein